MTDQFDPPGSTNKLEMKELNGQLILINPHKVEYDVNTVNGKKDATVADVHILDGNDAGSSYTDVFIWSKVIQSQIRTNIGSERYNLGRVSQGVAKPGQNPPWKLADPTDADRELARKYLSSNKFKENTTTSSSANDPYAGLPPSDDEPPF